MAAITTCSDFEATQKIKSDTVSTVSPSISYEVMGPDTMIFVFWMLSFKPTFSLSTFTFISSCCSYFCRRQKTFIKVIIMVNVQTSYLFVFPLHFFFFFGHGSGHVGSSFPDQGWNPHPLQWKLRVPTTGLSGNSLYISPNILKNVSELWSSTF